MSSTSISSPYEGSSADRSDDMACLEYISVKSERSSVHSFIPNDNFLDYVSVKSEMFSEYIPNDSFNFDDFTLPLCASATNDESISNRNINFSELSSLETISDISSDDEFPLPFPAITDDGGTLELDSSNTKNKNNKKNLSYDTDVSSLETTTTTIASVASVREEPLEITTNLLPLTAAINVDSNARDHLNCNDALLTNIEDSRHLEAAENCDANVENSSYYKEIVALINDISNDELNFDESFVNEDFDAFDEILNNEKVLPSNPINTNAIDICINCNEVSSTLETSTHGSADLNCNEITTTTVEVIPNDGIINCENTNTVSNSEEDIINNEIRLSPVSSASLSYNEVTSTIESTTLEGREKATTSTETIASNTNTVLDKDGSDSGTHNEPAFKKNLNSNCELHQPHENGSFSHLDITKIKVPCSGTPKKHFCIFCKTLQTKLSRHLLGKHRSEKQIKSILKLPQKHKERLKVLDELRKDGAYLHNTSKSLNTGTLIVSRRQQANRTNDADDYVSCKNCKLYLSKRSFRLHFRKCNRNNRSIHKNPEISPNYDLSKVSVPHSGATKRHFCIFCKTLQTTLPRHFLLQHRSEKQIKAILKLPKKHEERLRVLNQLRKEGDFLHNTSKSLNTGKLIVSRQQQATRNNDADHYACCKYCKGFFSRQTLRMHVRKCAGIKKNDRTNFIASRRLTQYIHETATEKLKTLVFPRLNDDAVTKIIRYDELIIKFGNQMAEKYTRRERYDIVRSQLRLLGRFKIAVRNLCPELEALEQVFRPEMLRNSLRAFRKVTNWDSNLKCFKTPSAAYNLLLTIKKCVHLRRQELKKVHCEVLSDLDEFFGLWNRIVPRVVSKSLSGDVRRRRKRSPANSLSQITADTSISKKQNTSNLTERNCDNANESKTNAPEVILPDLSYEKDKTDDKKKNTGKYVNVREQKVQETPTDKKNASGENSAKTLAKQMSSDPIGEVGSGQNSEGEEDVSDAFDDESKLLSDRTTILETTSMRNSNKTLSRTPGGSGPIASSNFDITKLSISCSGATKQHFCIFCKTLQTKLPRHFLAKHRSEKQIKAILKLPKKHKERLRVLNQLRKEGDFLHNTSKSLNTGKLIVSRQQQATRNNDADHYACCKYCKGFFSRQTLRMHMRKCAGIKKNDRTNFIASRRLTQYLHAAASKKLRNEIFPFLKLDEFTKAIRYDELIIKLGNQWAEKCSDPKLYQNLRSRLRLLGRFKVAIMKLCPEVKELKQCFKPHMLNDCKKAFLAAANWDSALMWFKTPSTAQYLSFIIKTCAHLQRVEFKRLQQYDLKASLDEFLCQWEKEIAKLVNKRTDAHQENENLTADNVTKKADDVSQTASHDSSSDAESNSDADAGKKKGAQEKSPVRFSKIRRLQWTTEEQNAITLAFGCPNKLAKLPSLRECTDAINKFPALKRRTPPQVKVWIDNQRRKKTAGKYADRNESDSSNESSTSEDITPKPRIQRRCKKRKLEETPLHSGKIKRNRWSQEEQDAITSVFGCLKSLDRLPSLMECSDAINKMPILTNRTAPQLKSWIDNQRRYK